VSIFITIYESYLDIQTHFNLNLRDGMKAEYLNVPLSSSTRDWYKKWFYVQQEQEPFVAYVIAQILEQ
jgi:hypothetical protein